MAIPPLPPARPSSETSPPAGHTVPRRVRLRMQLSIALLAFGAGLLGAATGAGWLALGLVQGLALLLAGALLGGCLARLRRPPSPAPAVNDAASAVDPLTGAHGVDQLQRDLERPLGSGAQGLLAVLDIDGFQPLCAELGVPAGQRVLLGLAELLDQRLRRIDGLYRIGDDVFALRLPGLKLEEAAPRLYALHAELNAGLSRLPGRATLSIGAAYADSDEDGGSWLARAQAALREARSEGPSRVRVDGGVRTERVAIRHPPRVNPQALPPPR
jgi:diguanylate cyclase (GGDEF)-like protein